MISCDHCQASGKGDQVREHNIKIVSRNCECSMNCNVDLCGPCLEKLLETILVYKGVLPPKRRD